MAKLQIHSGVSDDFLDAYLWYAKQSQWAAERFEQQVQETIERIASDPSAGTAYDKTYRFSSLPNYPHRIIYRMVDEVVYIIAIYHPSRDESYWQQR